MNREGYDVALLVLIVIFMVLKATLIERRTRLGWALSITNMVLAVAFSRALLIPVFDWVDYGWVATTVRLAIAVSVLWCVGELLAARWIFIRTTRRSGV